MKQPVGVRCKCGRTFTEYYEEHLVKDAELLEIAKRFSRCPQCKTAEEEAIADRKRKEEEARRKEELEETYQQRLKESGLNRYRLAYDPEDRRGNQELFRFVQYHLDGCLWIAGKTGLCKSRILQYWGREALKDRTVQYWPSMDLLSALSENSKHISRWMSMLYRTDLLILDDLGSETVTEARMKYLFNIIDRRMTGFEQYKHGMIGRKLGWQLWIATNDNGSGLYKNMGNYAGPCIRRLQENCDVWEKF